MTTEHIKNKSRVLVLGDDGRSTLAVVRSLGRKGVSVVLGVTEKKSIAAASRFVSSVVVLPSHTDNLDGWLEKLKDIVTETKFDLVIPATESVYVPLAERYEEFASLALFAVTGGTAFENTFFKNHTYELAKKLAIPSPHTRTIEHREDFFDGFNEQEWKFPLVIKPNVSKVWRDGYRLDMGVRIAHNVNEMRQYAEHILFYTPVLLQEYISGVGVGQEFLCEDGHILRAFQHERIHEFSGSGGSSYRKSVSLDLHVLEYSKKILAELRWTGVIMIEYRIDPVTRSAVLLEINGRFWGSLPLAIAAGANFPFELYELLAHRRNPVPRKYRVGVYARNVWGDMRWLMRNVSFGMLFVQMVAMAWRMLFKKEVWDTFTWDDPIPAIRELLVVLHGFTRRGYDAIHKAVYRLTSYKNFAALVHTTPVITFVCWGNIARSPFAEQYMRALLQKNGNTAYAVYSAGIHPRENRSAHPYAQEAAHAFGVTLDAHCSAVLTDDMVRRSGVIVCMGFREFWEIKKRFPSARNKIFLLGMIDSKHGYAIADPWGGEYERYEEAFARIADAVEKLTAMII